MMKIVKVSDGRTFIFKNPIRISDTKSQNLTPMPIVGTDYKEGQVLAINGISRNIQIDTTITNSDTDVSDGTNTTEVKTTTEQHIYLMDLFDPDNRYLLYHDDYFPTGEEGAITSIQITDDADKPDVKHLSFGFVFGQVSTFE